MGILEIRCDSIGCVNLAGEPSERARRDAQQRMAFAQEPIYAGEIIEYANIIGHHDRDLRLFTKCFFEVVAMSLDSRRNGSRIEAVRPVTYTPATAARTERKDLPEAIEQQVDAAVLQMSLQHFRVGIRQGTREPGPKAFSSSSAMFLGKQF